MWTLRSNKLFFTAAAFLLFMAGGALHAVEVRPEALVFRGEPGEKHKKQVVLHNRSEAAAQLELKVFLDDGVNRTETGKLKVSDKKLELAPGESKTVTITCKIPKGKGEIVGGLLVRDMANARRWIEQRSLHRIYILVAGTEIASADFTAVKAGRVDHKLLIETWLSNTGNIHLQPKLVAEVIGKDGAKVSKVFDVPVSALAPKGEARFSTLVDVGGLEAVTGGAVTGFFADPDGNIRSVQKSFDVKAAPKE